MQTIIIGNGIVALSFAYGVLQASTKNQVTIIGPASRNGAATLAAAAMLNSYAEIEHDSFKSQIDVDRFNISKRATELWPEFEKELKQQITGDPPYNCSICTKGGRGCYGKSTYIINNASTDELDDKNYNAIRRALVENNKSFADVDPSEIRGYKPHSKYRAIRALRIDDEGWYNPTIFLDKLEKVLSQSDRCSFVNSKVKKLDVINNEIKQVLCDDGRYFSADKFVLAAGASCSKILSDSKMSDIMQRVFYGVGLTIEIKSNSEETQEDCIRTPNRGLACGTYSAPKYYHPDYAQDRVVIGASNFISPWPQEHARLTSVYTLMKAAQTEINSSYYKADFIRANVGWRPTSSDTYPLIGWSEVGNLFIVTGTKRDGFHLAPYIRHEVVNLFLGTSEDHNLRNFEPSRSLIKNLTREEGIEKAVAHKLSAEYQHGYSPPLNNSVNIYKMHIRDELERLHDSVGALDWGIPPEMLDMYRYGHING